MVGTAKTSGIVLNVARQRWGAMPSVVTLYDHSRFGNDGAMTDITWTQLPSGLWVMDIDSATDEVAIPDDISLSPTNAITMLAWIRGDFTDWAWNGKIFSKRAAGNNHDYFLDIIAQGQANEGGIRFNFYDGVAWRAGVIDDTVLCGDDVWHQIGVTFDAANYIYYVDGEQGMTTACAFTMIRSGGILNIGRGAVAQEKYIGLITLAEIYSYPLTAGQILQRYEATRGFFGGRFAT